MAQRIIVVGHKNPDNDSIVSAVAYANLKNITSGDDLYVPVRLGPMPIETAWLFEEYGLEVPAEVSRVEDGVDGVVLVDHNESAQSIDGIKDAPVVEVIDHHRIGDIQTSSPIFFLALPVGSTATIIASRYKHKRVDITRPIAAILLSAILTDTVLLKSPTTTDMDRRTVEELAGIVGVEPIEFGFGLFRMRSENEEFSVDAIFNTDAKEFHVGENVVYIAQYETVDKESVVSHMDAIREEAQRICDERSYYAVVLMITDIIQEGTELVAAGDIGFVEGALGISLASGSTWMPGVLSRKKQVAAKVVAHGS